MVHRMNTSLKKPIRLLRAGAWRTYTGGRLIEKLHGNENALDSHFPEEWIMSTVKARNSGREHIVEGLSMVCENDISLADIISSNPIEALGKKHFKRYGASLGVLVKLIDSAERLTIQVHPSRQKAKELFESCFGKTECWHILGCRKINGENPCIYFGFKEGISREYWKDVFDKQDIDAMLGCLHKFDVSPGDTFLIEGGIPHAIGAGCFLVEIQEPTDYTIRTERRTPSGLDVSDFMCHQGLGFDKMFDCFDYTGYSKQEVIQRWKIEKDGNNIVGYDNTEMFRLEQIDVDGTIDITSDGAFSGIYILDGEGMVHTDIVTGGYQYFISACCEPFKISGKMKIMRFYGPK